MNVRLLAEAEHELFTAAVWYEDQQAGVGMRFLAAYEVVLQTIRERADSMPRWEDSPVDRDIRRVRLRRFPYLIAYELFEQEVVILAVAHTSRRPAYWMGRRDD